MNYNYNTQYLIVKGLAGIINGMNSTHDSFDYINKHLKQFGLQIGPIDNTKPETKNILLSDVGDKVCDILIDFMGVEEKDVKLHTNFYNDLGMDGLDHVEFIMLLEKEFNIHIDDEHAETAMTVGDIISLIEEKK